MMTSRASIEKVATFPDNIEALARTTDRTTRMHLEDARVRIDRILNPRS